MAVMMQYRGGVMQRKTQQYEDDDVQVSMETTM